MLTNTQIIERLQTQANTVLAARQAFEAKRDEVTALRAEIALHRKGAEAADSEARGIREETAGLLRALAGQLTKHFRDLKAKERAAYTLAEDFRELVANLELMLEEAEDDARSLLASYLTKANHLRVAYADALIEEGLATLPPALIAGMRFKATSLDAEDRWATWKQFTFSTANQHALAQLTDKLPAALNRQVEFEDSPIEDALRLQDRAGIEPETSPAARARRNQQRAQRKAELAS